MHTWEGFAQGLKSGSFSTFSANYAGAVMVTYRTQYQNHSDTTHKL
jgi:hypothetical protein